MAVDTNDNNGPNRAAPPTPTRARRRRDLRQTGAQPVVSDRLPVVALLTLAAAGFVTMMAEAMPVGLLLPMAADLNITSGQAGVLVSFYALGTAGAAVPVTAMTRTLPRKSLLLTLMGIFFVTTAITAMVPNYLIIVIARIIAGMSAGVLWAMLAGYAVGLAPPDKQGRAMSIAMAGTPLALAFGVPLGTWIGDQFTWQTAFYAMMWATLGLMALMVIVLPRIPGETSRERQTVATVLTLPGMRTVVLGTLFFALGHNVVYTYLAKILQMSNQETSIAVVQLAFGAAAAGGLYVIGALVDRSLASLIRQTCIALAITFVILGLTAKTPALVLVAVLLWGLSFGGTPTLFQTASALNSGPSRDVGQAMIVMAWNSAVAIGGAFGAAIIDRNRDVTIDGVTYNPGATMLVWLGAAFAVIAVFIVTVNSRAFLSQSDRNRLSLRDARLNGPVQNLGATPPANPSSAPAPTISRRATGQPDQLNQPAGPAPVAAPLIQEPPVAEPYDPLTSPVTYDPVTETYDPERANTASHAVVDVRDGVTPSISYSPMASEATPTEAGPVPLTQYGAPAEPMTFDPFAAAADQQLPSADEPQVVDESPMETAARHLSGSPFDANTLGPDSLMTGSVPTAEPAAPPAVPTPEPVNETAVLPSARDIAERAAQATPPTPPAAPFAQPPTSEQQIVGLPPTGGIPAAPLGVPIAAPRVGPRTSVRPGVGQLPPTTGNQPLVGTAADQLPNLSTGVLLQLEETLGNTVIGQGPAVAAIAASLRRFRIAETRNQAPLASFLLTGPAGVGRTQLLTGLADALYASRSALVRVHLSRLYGESLRTALMGTPNNPGQLHAHLVTRGNAVIVIDEPQNGPADTVDVLEELLTAGKLTGASGDSVDVSGCVVVLSTTSAHRPWLDSGPARQPNTAAALALLKEQVGAQVAGAIDDVAHLTPLSPESLRKIAVHTVQTIAAEQAGHNATVPVSSRAQTWFVEHALQQSGGVQRLIDVVKSTIAAPLAQVLHHSQAHDSRPVVVDLRPGQTQPTAFRYAANPINGRPE